MTQRSNMSIVDRTCPSCGHHNKDHQGGTIINELAGLPAGVKFDPRDQELLQHLEAKVGSDIQKLHPLINDFIPTLESQNGIYCTHSHKLPAASTEESGVFVCVHDGRSLFLSDS